MFNALNTVLRLHRFEGASGAGLHLTPVSYASQVLWAGLGLTVLNAFNTVASGLHALDIAGRTDSPVALTLTHPHVADVAHVADKPGGRHRGVSLCRNGTRLADVSGNVYGVV